MKRKGKNKLTERLREYSKTAKEAVSGKKARELLVCSLAAGPLLAAQTPALAMVRHTSGATRTLQATSYGYFQLDFNNDGVTDVTIFMDFYSSGSGTTLKSFGLAGIYDYPTYSTVSSYTMFNYFLGTVTTTTFPPFFVQTLPSSYMIRYTSAGSNYWIPLVYPGMLGFQTTTTTTAPISTIGKFPGQGDKIFGVEFFVPFDNTWHYGWVKVAVAADVKSMQIKEWAYETCADEMIQAGATTGGADCPVPVPTLTEWGRIVFILILCALAVRAMKKKREEETA